MRRALGYAAMVLALTAVRARAAAAQARSATVSVTANVGKRALVFGDADLAFGNVFPGVAKTVAPTDAGAGRFHVRLRPGDHVTLVFDLPTQLVGPGGATLPIGSWTGLWNTTNSTAGATAFTPSSSATTIQIGSGGGAASYVFVGARVSPAATQPAGAYTATITLTGAYAGF